ncbi:hypothetical protein LXL04_039061 [Taraxacum kok-saghyz]
MELNDCNSVYWKTKFIDGLPNLFAERVKNQLRIDNNIPCSENESDINIAEYDSDSFSESEDIECNCKNEEECSCEIDHQLYLIQSQFQDNLTINVISNDVAELLPRFDDPIIRQKIIENLDTREKEIENENLYSMKQVHNMLKERVCPMD